MEMIFIKSYKNLWNNIVSDENIRLAIYNASHGNMKRKVLENMKRDPDKYIEAVARNYGDKNIDKIDFAKWIVALYTDSREASKTSLDEKNKFMAEQIAECQYPYVNLYTVGVILEYAIEWGPLAIIVIFQPEIRNVLESIGRTQLLGRHKVLSTGEKEKIINEIMKAMDYFRRNKIGALIVIEREVSLQEYISNSTKIYGDISEALLESLFYPNSALHDGGVIIQGDKITCAGSVFKTSMNQNLSKKLGTRHRAALGIAEESDALALVASEETGRLSIAKDSELHYNLTNEEFRTILLDELNNKSDIFFDADDVEEDQNA